MEKAVIIINPLCHQGKGWKRWQSIRSQVLKKLAIDSTEFVLEDGLTLSDISSSHLCPDAKTLIISAGGDGSVHCLVNYLLHNNNTSVTNVAIGAIGLGSSNDFLKPFGEKIRSIPVLIDHSRGILLHDVGVATFYDEKNIEYRKYFIVNASVGVTAEANWNFNHPGIFLRILKEHATGAAIVYTAVNTIIRQRNVSLSLAFDGELLETSISNINILKVPYVSGSFYYENAGKRNDGQLGLNVCMNMSKFELLSTLNGLQKGKFPQSNKTFSRFTKEITITADRYFVFECDGETEKTNSLQLSILPNAIAVLKQ